MGRKQDFKECCVYAITETRLDSTIPDSAVTAPGFTLFRQDRVREDVDKEGGGGVCFYINDSWCTDAKVLSQTCTSEVESLTIHCRQFYLPRETPSLLLTVVYTHPEVDAASAIYQISAIVTGHENANPGPISIVSGDFNHTNLRKNLSKFYQHVTCHTRKEKTLDHCYTPIKGSYRS